MEQAARVRRLFCFPVYSGHPIKKLNTPFFMARYYNVARLPRIELLRPELGLWGGLLLLMSFVFMSSAKFAPNLPVVQLPASAPIPGCILRESYSSTVELAVDRTGRVYLYSDYPLVRTGFIEYVAAQQGVHFTVTQRQQLSQLPYVGLPVKELPAYLNSSEVERKRFFLSGIPKDELSAYIDAAKIEAGRIYAANMGPSQPQCFLRLDERLSGAQVTQLFRLLEQHKIHRFHLVTESE